MEQQVERSERVLIILVHKANFQLYDLMEKKWSQLRKFPDENISSYHGGAVLNSEFYFISGEPGPYQLKKFNPLTGPIEVLNSLGSIRRISVDGTMCAGSRFLYLCGGRTYRSDKVLKYNPQTKAFENDIPPMRTRRAGAKAIFYRHCLHVLGGQGGPPSSLNKVENYDSGAKEWVELPPMCQSHQVHAAAVLDGKLYACGGDPSNSVQVYDPKKIRWQPVASMEKKREGFTLVAYEGKLLAIGGREEKSVEVYDPDEDRWQMDDKMSLGLQMEENIGGLISTNCVTDAQ